MEQSGNPDTGRGQARLAGIAGQAGFIRKCGGFTPNIPLTNAEMTADHLPFYQTTNWYDTDASHHVIPRDFVYFAKTADGRYAAFSISNYYDSQGNSGVFTINWKYLTD